MNGCNFSIILSSVVPRPTNGSALSSFEQLWPTDAFGILFEGFMRPLDQALFGLVARIMGLNPDDREVKLRALAIKGEIQISKSHGVR